MLFVQEQYQYLLPQVACEEMYAIHQFEHQEYYIQLHHSVQGKRCVVIGSLTASADQQLSLMMLLHTLQSNHAQSIILFSPYLGYQRQDSCTPQQSFGMQFAQAIISATGVTQVITIEPHHPMVLSTAKVPTLVYSSEYFFSEDIAHFVGLGFSFVFPDAGAVRRHSWIPAMFPAVDYGWFEKKRDFAMIQLQKFEGKVGRKAIIVDDILDSGQTLLAVCIALRQMGVEEMVIFVTHAFFHGHAWHDLWALGVQMVYCTDTVPQAHAIRHVRIRVKSINFFLHKSI